jgi:ABC-type transporter Mla MlaB component
MLRITVHESEGTWRLTLSGKLAGPWVAETANVWRSAPHSDKQIEVDLNEVTGLDAAGRSLLVSMHQAGARLRGIGVENSALIVEITATHGTRRRDHTHKRNQKGERP